jgi:peroxiredoxin-like protein
MLSSPGLAELATAPPAEFGGPGDLWSPETLLVGAVANCFILSFRAIARASKLEWKELSCRVEGVLDRTQGKTQFTELNLSVRLQIAADTSEARAQRILEKAEETCLITNSMTARIELKTEIVVL